ncbi:MAG: hypothetical protein ACM3ZE_30165, partial [Myxococcales bacterium]
SELKQAPPVPVPVEPAAPAQAQTDELEASPAKPAQEAEHPGQASAPLPTKRMAAKSVISKVARAQYYDQEAAATDADAVVQTGPGMPQWKWKRVNLAWSGPVRQDQQIRLYLLGPTWSAVFGCLRVIGVVWLAFLLVRRTAFGAAPPSVPKQVPLAGALASVLVLCLPSVVQAQPRTEILDELKARLVRTPDCDGCIEVERLELQLARRSLETESWVHAGRVTDYRIPGPVRSWVPSKVLVDGKPAEAMVLGSDGFLHVRLENGSHRVQTSGPVASNEIVIAPGSPAHRVVVSTVGWSVDGLRDGRVENSLHFTAEDRPNQKPGEAEPAYSNGTRLPPWLEITRSIEIGVTWRITTEVTRKSPLGDPISIRYPLLTGEEVTTNNALVEQGQLLIALGRDDEKVSYQSVVKQVPEFTLTAIAGRPLSEEWHVRCGALWHCDFDGVAPFLRVDQGNYFPQFRPWPGERLTVKVGKPIAAPGESRTIEQVETTLAPGHRLLAGTLSLSVKVSKAYTQSVRLEPGSTVQTLTIDNREEPIRMNGSTVEMQLAPGRHRIQLVWHEPRPQATVFRTPQIQLNEKAVNARLHVELPRERWLLFTWGPSWGPKVLLWSYLLMLIAAGFILVRIPKNPLKITQWVLLGVGLTQVPIAVTLLIAGWFFAMALRGSVSVQRVWPKKLMQVGLVIYTLAFLVCLCGTVYDGLVSNPDMLVAGAANEGVALQLRWYVDRIGGAIPTATVISLPVVVFRLLNLLWALWLASNLLRWLKWGWSEFSKGGLWAKSPPRLRPAYAPAPGYPGAMPQAPGAMPQAPGAMPQAPGAMPQAPGAMPQSYGDRGRPQQSSPPTMEGPRQPSKPPRGSE